MAPQIILLIILAYGSYTNLISTKSNKSKIISIFAMILLLGLLLWGGFFNIFLNK